MIDRKNLRKAMTLVVIIAFVCQFHGDVFLHAQGSDELLELFNIAKNAYINGQYDDSKDKLELVIGVINEEGQGRKDILGQCYLLLGAIYEKEEKGTLARENYRRAKKVCGVETVKGVNLNELTIYLEVMGSIRIQESFENSRKAYLDGRYVIARGILEKLIGDIIKGNFDRDILRKSYLYMGAIYEKEDNAKLAEENYRKAIGKQETLETNGIDVDKLPLLKRIIKIIDNEKQFEKAKTEYLSGQYSSSRSRLNRTIGIIINQGGQEVTLGKYYLLLGAIYEIEENPTLAGENYKRAKEYKIKSIDGVDFEKLPVYKRTMRKGVIQKPGTRKKKKFPILLVVGGVVVVAVLAALLFTKKKTETYTLIVIRGSGIDGTPAGGSTSYDKGSSVSYNYSLQSGYTNLVVTLEGTTVSSSGTVTMDQNHTLFASATLSAPQINRLTVTRGEGIDGTPGTGTYFFEAGTSVDYSYTLQTGYTDLVVTLDGNSVSASGTISMNSDHTLNAGASGSGPTVTITSHNNGDTVSKRIDIEGVAQSAKTISKVELWVNNSLITSGTSASFSLRWNTKTVEDGTYTVKVIAYDEDNATGEAQVSLVVNNEATSTGPTVTITNPGNNSSFVRGTEVTIEVTATSNVGIADVEFYVDDKSIGTDSSEPFSINWDTTANLEGYHVIRVVAYDNDGLSGENQVTVTLTAQ